MNLQKLLLPTDFSENARQAYAAARSMAQKFGATVYLAHEVDSLPPIYFEHTEDGFDGVQYYARMEAELVDEAAHADLAGVPVETRLLHRGADHEKVLQLLDKEVFDLVILSTHGHTGPAHVLLGSFAESVARQSPVPVLTHRAGEGGDPFHPRSILVPYDFSASAAAAFPLATFLAKSFEAKLSALNVLPGQHELVYAGDALARVRERLFEDCERSGLAVERPEALTCAGVPHREIVAQARALGTDLIVLATHGYTGFQRLVFGSVAEKVLRHAPCSVLTVRPRRESSTAT